MFFLQFQYLLKVVKNFFERHTIAALFMLVNTLVCDTGALGHNRLPFVSFLFVKLENSYGD